MRRALLLLAVIAVTACGGDKASQSRRDVGDYLRRVDSVQYEQRRPLLVAHQAIVRFSHGTKAAVTARQLAQASATLTRLRKRIAAVVPPPEARTMRRLVLELYDRDIALTRELHGLAVFSPRFVAALRPVARANVAAKSSLARTKSPAAVAVAVRSYRAAVEESLKAARRLHAPPAERPLYDAQVARLEALDTSLSRLIAGLERHDAKAVARAEHAVSVASVSSDALAVQRAQRDAVIAYNRRVAKVREVAQRIRVERDRLQIHLR